MHTRIHTHIHSHAGRSQIIVHIQSEPPPSIPSLPFPTFQRCLHLLASCYEFIHVLLYHPFSDRSLSYGTLSYLILSALPSISSNIFFLNCFLVFFCASAFPVLLFLSYLFFTTLTTRTLYFVVVFYFMLRFLIFYFKYFTCTFICSALFFACLFVCISFYMYILFSLRF